LNDAPNGTLSSYGHAVLVIFFLTHSATSLEKMANPDAVDESTIHDCRPILPNLQLVNDDPTPWSVSNVPTTTTHLPHPSLCSTFG
jgi:hypothetical protein